MKNFVLATLLLLISAFSYSQDSVKFSSDVQYYSKDGGENIDTLSDKFEITLWADSLNRWVKFQDKKDTANVKTYRIEGLPVERSTNADSVLVGYYGYTVPNDYMVVVRALFKGEELISVGIVTYTSIKYFLLKSKENEL